MDLFTRDDLKALLGEPRTPCVSIFMPTHRGGAEADAIRWRVHLGEAEKALVAAGLRAADAGELLAPARQLQENLPFWKNQCDGLAFFLAPQFLRSYRLPVAFQDLVVVGGRFQITPLLPLFSGNGRFFVLALSQNAVRLLQGTRDRASEVDLKGVPRSLAEALLTHDRDEPLQFHGRPTSGGTWGAIFSGQGVGIDDAKDNLLRYFQKIDRGLHALLREEHAPLVLAAVEYLQPLYRQANTYAHLLEGGIAGNPDRLSNQELHQQAWALVQPSFDQARKNALALYEQAAAAGKATGKLDEVMAAAVEGRVATLFVAANRLRWGQTDWTTAKIAEHDQAQPGDEDLLNLAAVLTLRHGQSVYALESSQMPGGSLAAAVFHLPLPKHGKRP